MTREEEIVSLKERIAAREKRPGYAKNVEALKQRLAELESAQ